MGRSIYVIHHATDLPERAALGLYAAAAAARAGQRVDVWLSGEGIRLGIEGVAETLREPLPETAPASIAALVAAGGELLVDRTSFDQRGYEADALRAGARLVETAYLGERLAAGAVAVTM